MRVAITTIGSYLDSPVDTRFGRCAFFLIFDSESGELRAVQNSAAFSDSGAGIAAAQTLSRQAVDALITGQVGPNAFQVLSAAKIRCYVVHGGTARRALESLQAGTLTEMTAPTTPGAGGRGGFRTG